MAGGRKVLIPIHYRILSTHNDFALEYSKYDAQGGNAIQAEGVFLPPEEGDVGVSIFRSIQKLGLVLQPRKLPLEFIVAERADKVPVEN